MIKKYGNGKDSRLETINAGQWTAEEVCMEYSGVHTTTESGIQLMSSQIGSSAMQHYPRQDG